MKIKDIVNQLSVVLPTLTDYFTDSIEISSITCAGTTATAITTAAHNLLTGNYVNIHGALTPNPIISLSHVDNIATAETANNHDLTQGFQQAIQTVGADQAEYNGVNSLSTVLNRKNFEYIISGSPTSPATGSPFLLENLKYGYNGWKEITVVDPTTFTYEVSQAQQSPAYSNINDTIKCKINLRIHGAISLERAIASYTKQPANSLMIFVVMGNRTANKDRQATTDQTASFGQGMDYRQLMIQPFSVYVFIPSTAHIAGRYPRDLADDLLKLICNSIARVTFPSVFSQPPYSPAVFVSDSFAVYNSAVYIHEFTFETTEYINYEDTVAPDFGTAFRDIDSSYLSDFSGKEIMTDYVNLDNEPLP